MRTMLWGLRSLLKFEDTSRVADPELRVDAEQFKTLHSSRFIYLSLIPCFLEAEGLLDEITMDRCVQDLEYYASRFREPCNAMVAKLAPEQET